MFVQTDNASQLKDGADALSFWTDTAPSSIKINKQVVFAVLPTGCGKSLIFQLVPKVCEYLHDQGFEYPKAAILVVVCPLSALIDSHIQELKDHGLSACSLTD